MAVRRDTAQNSRLRAGARFRGGGNGVNGRTGRKAGATLGPDSAPDLETAAVASKTFNCRLITPEAKVLDEPVTQAIVPAWDGQIGFLHNRAPMVTKLGIGELRLDFPDENGAAGGSRSYFVEDGFAHMVANNLTILAAGAIAEERLSLAEAEAELAEANARRTEGISAQEAESIRRDRQRAQMKVFLARAFRARGGAI